MKHEYEVPKRTSEERNVARYLSEIARFPPLSATTDEAYVRCLPDPETQTTLIEGYLHYVVQIARQYLDQGVPLMDLIGEGNLCLVQVVQAFHTEHSTPFCRYLDEVLHQTMKQAICDNAQYGPQGSLLPLDVLEQKPTSCHRVLSAYGKPEDVLLAQEACAGVLGVLLQISPSQRRALAHYYGFVSQFHGSFAAVGRELGISPSAVRASVIAGMQKLRRARQALRALLDDSPYNIS